MRPVRAASYTQARETASLRATSFGLRRVISVPGGELGGDAAQVGDEATILILEWVGRLGKPNMNSANFLALCVGGRGPLGLTTCRQPDLADEVGKRADLSGPYSCGACFLADCRAHYERSKAASA